MPGEGARHRGGQDRQSLSGIALWAEEGPR